MTRSGLAAVVIAVAALGVGPLAAQSSAAAPGLEELLANTTTSDWTDGATVDSTRDVGAYVGVALEAGTGAPYVSYYDKTNGGLWFARFLSANGNCGPNNSWECQLVDGINDTGLYNSIAVHPLPTYSEVAIAYHDVTLHSLKVAIGTCGPPTPDRSPVEGTILPLGCGFTIYTIAAGVTNLSSDGQYTSVVFDSDGVPYVAYQHVAYFGDDTVRVAYPVSAGTGNCGTGAAANNWQCDSILSGAGLGSYTAIVVDPVDRPAIGFYDAGNGVPMYALKVGPGGNCGPSNTWSCESLELPSHDTGRSATLFVGQGGTTHLAYLDSTTAQNELIYAKKVVSGGNCGPTGAWQCDVIVDDVGAVGIGRVVAMTGGHVGEPLIAYREATSDYGGVLRLAQPLATAPAGSVGNCGPMYSWACSSLDVGGSWLDEAAAVAISRSSTGCAVAYHELDTYFYPAEGNLKVTMDIALIFKDGFGSGDASAWSSQNP